MPQKTIGEADIGIMVRARYANENLDVTIQQVCALVALTVRKPGLASKKTG